MSGDLTIVCRCRSVHGVVRGASAGVGNRVVCYCDNCQAFARHLERDDLLDANGGSDIFQTSSARIELTDGLDRLACLRLTPNGPLRWYTRCCNTPIGNTLATYQLPFIGLILSCTETDGQSLDDLIGPVRQRVMARFAVGDRSCLVDAHDRFALSVLVGTVWRLLRWRLAGDHKRSPFFDSVTHRPIVEPSLVWRSASPGT